MKTVWIGLVVILALILGFCAYNSNQKQIKVWVDKNQYEIVSNDLTFMDNGPFYFRGKGQSINKIVVKTKDNEIKTYYSRTGLFGIEIEEYKK